MCPFHKETGTLGRLPSLTILADVLISKLGQQFEETCLPSSHSSYLPIVGKAFKSTMGQILLFHGPHGAKLARPVWFSLLVHIPAARLFLVSPLCPVAIIGNKIGVQHASITSQAFSPGRSCTQRIGLFPGRVIRSERVCPSVSTRIESDLPFEPSK